MGEHQWLRGDAASRVVCAVNVEFRSLLEAREGEGAENRRGEGERSGNSN